MKKTYVSLPSISLIASALLISSAQAGEVPELDLGGAARLSYQWKDYDQVNKGTAGKLDFEMFRINAKGRFDNFILDAEYRIYPYFNTIHHAYIGYEIDQESTVKVGVHQVPFGINPMASHSFWASGNYFTGLEDDYDSGIKYEYRNDGTMVDLAWYSGTEISDASNLDRFSIDIVTQQDSPFKEANSLNGRYIKRVNFGQGHVDLGGSVQLGQIYNTVLDETDGHYAVSAHLDAYINDWNLQIQAAEYDYDIDAKTIKVGGFTDSYAMPSKGRSYVLNLAHSWSFKTGLVKALTCYNDYTYMEGDDASTSSSVQNVTGCVLQNGSIATYVDWIAGKNMYAAGGPGIALSGANDDRWNSRLNINIGYYF